MRYLLFLSISLFSLTCQAQATKQIVSKELISVYKNSVDIYKITYLSDGLKVKGILVQPKEKGNYPCIIYNRGGNKDFGAISKKSASFLLAPLAMEGYIVIASQYRGNAGGEGQEEFGGTEINDVLYLVKALEEIEGANTEKIGMYGWSRGGMMTYLALTKTNKIKAAVVGGAVSNQFATIKDRPGMEGVLENLVPDYYANKEAELTKRSAVKWVHQFPKMCLF